MPDPDFKLVEIAGNTTGSSNPTYTENAKRVALTAGGRRLVVHGLHGTGQRLRWSDDGDTWSNVTRGDTTDGTLLSVGTGDNIAAICVGNDSGSNEVAVVVFSGINSTDTNALQARRLTDLDNASGPNVGALQTLVAGGANDGNMKADIGKEAAASGHRMLVVWMDCTAASTFQGSFGWITDLTTDSLTIGSTGTYVSAGSFRPQAHVIEKPASSYDGLAVISRITSAGGSGAKIHIRSSSDGLTTFSTGSATGATTPTSNNPVGVRLGTEWIVAGVTDNTNGVVTVNIFDDTGAAVSTPLTTPQGYWSPVLVWDGVSAFLIMRRGAATADANDTVATRRYITGAGWSAADQVEVSGEGGTHNEPNGLRDGSALKKLVIVCPSTGAIAQQRRVLVVERRTAIAPARLVDLSVFPKPKLRTAA